jgi:ribosomal protein S6E (S10)
MKQFTVRLENETIGTIYSKDIDDRKAESLIGKKVVVHLIDENGNPIERRGKLFEILEKNECHA